MNGKPETVSELYPRPWLKAGDLGGKAVTVRISEVDLKEFHMPDGSFKLAIVLAFDKATKKLICNKTQSFTLARVLGTERLADWPGKAVTLAPGQAPNGKQTILVKEAQNGG